VSSVAGSAPAGSASHRGGAGASGMVYLVDVMIEIGQTAPDFELPDQDGNTVALHDLRGKPVVLYFYPKADTPGCTTQACGIRDVYGELQREGAVVLGVSPDDERSHVKFKQKYDLPFTLLADPDHAVAEEYGVWGEKKYMGRTYMGVNRSTFVIDADGNVKRVMHKVKPDTHADEVLETLRT
jgi:thioredoxin-dependent peroxiredoxin